MATERILGRADELAVIERFLDSIPDGPARLLAVTGPAGIGKSTLWNAARAAARSRTGLTLLRARATSAERDLAYGALADILGPIVETGRDALPPPQRDALDGVVLLAARPGGIADPRTIGTAVLGLLRRAALERPVAIFIDDLPWVDAASAAALEFALRRMDAEPIGIIATIRTGESAPRPTLPDAVSSDRRLEVALGAVSLAVLHHLVLERAGAILSRPQLIRLEAASGGNPLLALEMAAELQRRGRWPLPGEPLPIPADTAALIGDRITRLAVPARELLFVAAAMARPTVEYLRAAIGSGADEALEQAVNAGLIDTTARGEVRLIHPLMAAAATDGIGLARRRRLQRRLAYVATSVEDRGRHVALAAAEPSERDASDVAAAATSARQRGAVAAAAAWAEVAADLTPAATPGIAAGRRLLAARWHSEIGATEAALILLDAVVGGLPAGDDRAQALLLRAQIDGWQNGPRAAAQGAERALADAVEPDLRARLLLRIAVDLADLEPERAQQAVETALTELAQDPAADPDLLACALLQRAMLEVDMGRQADAATVARAAALLADAPRAGVNGVVPPESLRAHGLLAEWAAEHDDLETARELTARNLQRDLDQGHDRPAPINLADLTFFDIWLGDQREAEDHARLAAELANQTGASPQGRMAAASAAAVVAAHRGDHAAARAVIEEGLALSADLGDWQAMRLRATLGFVQLADGDHQGAATTLGSIVDDASAADRRSMVRNRLGGDLVEAAVAIGDWDRAVAAIETLDAAARTTRRPWVTVMAARGRALLHAADGELDAAQAAITEALDAATALPMPFERARTELIAGRIARRRKQRRLAGEHLDRARATFMQVGAGAWVTIAEAEVARLGRRTAQIDALTETEDHVARLAASGMTNREVAEAAFLTAKSVEGVLSRVYSKLGIRSRAELGAWMASAASSSERDSPVSD
jgi:DNA-binding CsgD family transcriptional regulator